MLNYERIARRLIQHFAEYPGVGHSRSVLYGAVRTEASIVVAEKADQKRAYSNIKPHQPITLLDIQNGVLDEQRRAKRALVIDNRALVAVLEGLMAQRQPAIAKKTKVKGAA